MAKSKRTRVVNKNNNEWYDVYIGRGSKFGNPYEIGKDGSREEVIEKYREWFMKKIKKERFRKEVLKLKGKKLGCYCSPKPCHGDVIVEWLEESKTDVKSL